MVLGTQSSADLGGVHLLHQYTSDILSDGQPANYNWQVNQSSENCHLHQKSYPWEEGQVDILFDSQSASCN